MIIFFVLVFLYSLIFTMDQVKSCPEIIQEKVALEVQQNNFKINLNNINEKLAKLNKKPGEKRWNGEAVWFNGFMATCFFLGGNNFFKIALESPFKESRVISISGAFVWFACSGYFFDDMIEEGFHPKRFALKNKKGQLEKTLKVIEQKQKENTVLFEKMHCTTTKK
ncbi:MAG: hypothetical protein M1114_01970 [Candidatus Dependentiae bacterium]|nr:hypothetical protein [Candidatus Dependentiae bacterium]